MYNAWLTILHLFLCLIGSKVSLAASLTGVGNSQLDSAGVFWLGGAVAAVVFCIVVVLVASQCMDCYNSEVATESHPACGYSKASSGNDLEAIPQHGYSTGASALPPPSNLPYSLNPAGYNSQPSAPSAPPPGTGGQWGVPQPQQRGRIYDGPESPPTYTEAMSGH